MLKLVRNTSGDLFTTNLPGDSRRYELKWIIANRDHDTIFRIAATLPADSDHRGVQVEHRRGALVGSGIAVEDHVANRAFRVGVHTGPPQPGPEPLCQLLMHEQELGAVEDA